MHATFGCGDVTRRLSDYLDSALPPDERQGVETHLATCEACRKSLQSLRATVGLLGRLPLEPMPPDLKARLLRHLKSDPPASE
jgi:anti-sigma factor RsiW